MSSENLFNFHIQIKQFESKRKWNSSMEDFLKSKEIKILEINENEIKFEAV